MNIAVTGASGFLGQHVVNNFLNSGNEVKVIGRSKNKLTSLFNESVECLETNYTVESLVEAFDKVDVVIHLAAKLLDRDTDPLKLSSFYESNILTFENILQACLISKVNRVVHSSSISIYSNIEKEFLKETDVKVSANIYGLSKYICENIGNYYSNKTNVKVTNLRFSRLFGYGDREGVVIEKYINLAKLKKPLIVHGTGSSSIEYLYIRDAVEALIKSIQPSASFGTYNIGSGRLYSIKEIAENINLVYDNHQNINFDTSKGDGVKGTLMDSSKAFKELNWQAKWNLNSALKDIQQMELNNKSNE